MLSYTLAYTEQFKIEINLFFIFTHAIPYDVCNPEFPTLTTEIIYFIDRE